LHCFAECAVVCKAFAQVVSNERLSCRPISFSAGDFQRRRVAEQKKGGRLAHAKRPPNSITAGKRSYLLSDFLAGLSPSGFAPGTARAATRSTELLHLGLRRGLFAFVELAVAVLVEFLHELGPTIAAGPFGTRPPRLGFIGSEQVGHRKHRDDRNART